MGVCENSFKVHLGPPSSMQSHRKPSRSFWDNPGFSVTNGNTAITAKIVQAILDSRPPHIALFG